MIRKHLLIGLLYIHAPIQRGGGGGLEEDPLEKLKTIGSLAILVTIPWKLAKLPSQHSMLGRNWPPNEKPFQWRWRAHNSPLSTKTFYDPHISFQQCSLRENPIAMTYAVVKRNFRPTHLYKYQLKLALQRNAISMAFCWRAKYSPVSLLYMYQLSQKSLVYAKLIKLLFLTSGDLSKGNACLWQTDIRS